MGIYEHSRVMPEDWNPVVRERGRRRTRRLPVESGQMVVGQLSVGVVCGVIA